MRISVSGWSTTDEDVERSLETIIRVVNPESAERVLGLSKRILKMKLKLIFLANRLFSAADQLN